MFSWGVSTTDYSYVFQEILSVILEITSTSVKPLDYCEYPQVLAMRAALAFFYMYTVLKISLVEKARMKLPSNYNVVFDYVKLVSLVICS